MLKTEIRTIGTADYKCSQFPARRGDVLMARLMRALGPVLGQALSEVADEVEVSSVEDLSLEAIGGALKSLAALDPEEYSKLQVDLLEMTCVGEQPITPQIFDMHFSGRYQEKFKVVAWVINFNFGDVFGAGGIGGLAAMLKDKKTAPRTVN